MKREVEVPDELWDWVVREALIRECTPDEFLASTIELRKQEQDEMQAALDANPELQELLTEAAELAGLKLRQRPQRPSPERRRIIALLSEERVRVWGPTIETLIATDPDELISRADAISLLWGMDGVELLEEPEEEGGAAMQPMT